MPQLNIPYSHSISTGEQCRETDRRTIEEFGIDGFTLMETAGLQAAYFIGEKEVNGATGLYFCGKGNNGGDALVIARYLAIQQNHSCHVCFPAGSGELSADAKRNFNLLLELKAQKLSIHIYESESEIPDISPDYIIDGLLGTGLTSNLRTPFDSTVALINSQKARTYSIDIPTGLHTDSGKLMPEAVRADYTLSFGALKPGFYLDQGPDTTGNIHHFNLSFPDHYRESFAKLISADLAPLLPTVKRKAEHKYSDRLLYIVAGSEGLTGAAIMAAASGWKTGVGAVVLISPKGLIEIYEKNLPDIIKSPVGKSGDTCFLDHHVKETAKILDQKKGVLLIGPGLGREKSTLSFAKQLLTSFNGPVVIDADALLVLPDLDKPGKAGWIITPHPGEAARLSGTAFGTAYDRLTWAAGYASKKNVTVVSKGHPTFIGTPEGNNYLTGYDTRIFARAGFGDVLAGAIAGNLAICNHSELSIIRALLDGYIKANRLIHLEDKPLEPKDLL
jgi:ADP-dependent NAD(P)H-hydrate dehydratase / NAD(P)H-hydrate epimerase